MSLMPVTAADFEVLGFHISYKSYIEHYSDSIQIYEVQVSKLQWKRTLYKSDPVVLTVTQTRRFPKSCILLKQLNIDIGTMLEYKGETSRNYKLNIMAL